LKRNILYILLLMICITAPLALAQNKSRAISEPGKISGITEKTPVISSSAEMECSLYYSDPSGDNTLSAGESAAIKVLVINKSSQGVIEPKLEIAISSSWAPTPRISVKLMDKVGPGEIGTYKASMNWDKQLPSGSITYEVKAIDKKSGLATEPARLVFQISGQGNETAQPLFVDVDQAIPKTAWSNLDAIAVVIGNRNYPNPDMPDVEYAVQDAATMKKYLVNMLGYRESNILYVENAGKADFERIFGTREVVEGKLYNWVKAGKSDVFIYYSGHGAPDMNNKKAYFMPSNSDPNYVQIDGYPLDIFYQNLDKLPAKSITIVLDACFSGGSQQGMLIKNASPVYIDVAMPVFGEKFNLFTSASSDQVASWYPDGNHSLFTYYFLRAIRGEADANRDRQVTVSEMNTFINENVPYMARRLYGREQTPVIKGDLNGVVCRY